MTAGYPVCPKCGAETRRAFTSAPPVLFHAAGFYSTDVTHFARQVGPERAARFEKFRDGAEARARQGRLTPYEQALERAGG